MEWRCEWCGKPHEENDPPCDNCGHGSFERAVVPTKDISDGEQEAALVWVCTECGREHPKHSPPCSRCGNHDLEQSRLTLDDSTIGSPSYWDLASRTYVLAAAVIVILAGVVVLGLAGGVSIPGLSDGGVPGDSSQINGASLDEAEAAYLAALDRERRARDTEPFERSEELDEAAAAVTEEWVLAEYENEAIDEARIDQALSGICSSPPAPEVFVVPDDRVGEDPGAAMIDYRLADADGAVFTTGDRIGIDTHAGPDGKLFVSVVVC